MLEDSLAVSEGGPSTAGGRAPAPPKRGMRRLVVGLEMFHNMPLMVT